MKACHSQIPAINPTRIHIINMSIARIGSMFITPFKFSGPFHPSGGPVRQTRQLGVPTD